ncbi:hypothetical protein CSA80_01950 [Candidatus Saccharibacteria bacterium]|nr:MAG: hypothetical protein CSA80_01950 [Candidatus Saccharibacteria bacterium]
MKRIGLVAVVIAVLVGAFLLLSKPAHSPEISKQPTAKLSFATVQNEASKGSAFLIDVRTAEEYAAGHFPSAINHSLQDIQAAKYPKLAKDTPIYLYCNSGNRSGQAAKLLKEAGYTVITDLGGIDDVKAMGGKLTKQP